MFIFSQYVEFDINEETAKIISQIKGPIGIIAVAGMYRTGKSYLLNRMLLNRQGGFDVGPSINPCTKGLWVWGSPIQGFTADGKPVNVLVVDSEGIGGLDEDNNHDMRIFSLALLLSSYFIYNSTGSIDENALSSLSLVVNLTKHIQIQSNQEDSEDFQSYQEVLPSFIWVVRDFSLQLVDEESNHISEKEYLERALTEKGGKDDDIRKYIKLFFSSRDCCTMIRPLTNENELQNLNNMNIEELRQEFIEKVMELRRKVINQMKVKEYHNSPLDGQMWTQLITQYVESINAGGVPNIQASWTYICKQRGQQILQECISQFQQMQQEYLSLPMPESELLSNLEDFESQLLDKFKKAKIDEEVKEQYNNQLISFITEQKEEIKQQNGKEILRCANELCTQLFNEYEQTIRQGEISTIEQIDQTLNEIYIFYCNNCYEFLERDLIFQEQKAQFLQHMLYYFTQKYSGEIILQKQLLEQVQERLEQQINESRIDLQREKEGLESRLFQAIQEKSEHETSKALIKEQYENLKSQYELEIKYKDEQINELTHSNQQQNDHSKMIQEQQEEKYSKLHLQHISSSSEYEKQQALYEQKVIYLEKILKEKNEKDYSHVSDLEREKHELSNEVRQIQQKLEQELKMLTLSYEEEQERSIDLETRLKEKEAAILEKNLKWNETEKQYKLQLQQLQDHIKQIETNITQSKVDTERCLQIQSKEKDVKNEQLLQQIQEFEHQIKELQDGMKVKEHERKKESAIMEQKVQFLEMQLVDCKDQLEEQYKQHESMVRALKEHQESSIQTVSTNDSKYDSLMQEFVKEKDEAADLMRELRQQIELAHEKQNELELQLKLDLNDYQREVSDLKILLEEGEQQKVQMQDKCKLLEASKQSLISEQNDKLAQIIAKFESEIEEKDLIQQKERHQIQQQSEESLQQLKEFYESEKEKIELRLQEEKDRYNKKMHLLQDDLESRMRDELAEKEDELECLQHELQEYEQRNNQQLQVFEQELQLKTQTAESFEQQLRDMQKRAEQAESSRNQTFEKQMEFFEQQRQELNVKIEKLLQENLEKDRLIAQQQHKLERILEDNERKIQEVEQMRVQLNIDKKALQDKIDQQKKKLNDQQNECVQLKLENGREQALLKQQIEFYLKKIEEQQKQIDEQQRYYEERIKKVKQDVLEEAQQTLDRAISEKDVWESKYEMKRKALKEIELSLMKSHQEQERKCKLLELQLQEKEQEKLKLDEQYQEEISQLNAQIQQLDSNAGAAYYYGSANAEDLIKMKQSIQELEREYADLQATYDRDKALWEGKCQFLEQQKETYKRDLNESQKKFEITLEQLQKRGSIDKDKIESNQQALIKVIENKYKNQIREMQDIQSQQNNEAWQKVKRLEQEVKILNERLQMESRGKLNEQGSYEKKLHDLIENEKRLTQEIDDLKVDRERRNKDQHLLLDREKDLYKVKLSDYEQKTKDAENRRATMMFEYEKERAKWQLEKDNLMCQKSELQEQLERVQHRKDQLLRENEKLRAENKGNRKFLFSNQTNQIQQQSTTSFQQSSQSSISANRYNVMTKSITQNIMHKMKENSNKYISDDNKNLTPNSKAAQQNRYH